MDFASRSWRFVGIFLAFCSAWATPAAAANPDLAAEFARSDNLAEFVGRNSAAALAGDGERAMYNARAYRECAPLGDDPNAFIVRRRHNLRRLATENASAQRFEALMQRELKRCGELIQRRAAQEARPDWIGIAASNGDLSAKVSRYFAEQRPLAAFPDLLSEVLQSKDAEALEMLGIMLCWRTEGDATPSEFSANADTQALWQLIACRFGKDCSRYGAETIAVCESVGVCADSLEAALAQIHAPEEFPILLQRRDRAVALIKRGNIAPIVDEFRRLHAEKNRPE